MPTNPERRKELKRSVFKKHAYKPTAPKIIAFLNKLYNQAARNTLTDKHKAEVLSYMYLNKNNSKKLREWNTLQQLDGKNLQYYHWKKTSLDSLVSIAIRSLN